MKTMFRLYDKVKLLGPVFLLVFMGMAGCQQNSIFDFISHEVKPTDPRIEGSPSKIVKAEISGAAKLYVANGSIWEYDMGGRWHPFGGPGGFVADVAATSGTPPALYALTIANTDTKVWKKTATMDWTQLGNGTGYGFIQNIYGAEDQLFATGAVKDSNGGNSGNYAILRENSGSFTLVEPTGGAILTGAGVIEYPTSTFTYYLGTLGNGIYKVTDTPAPSTVSSLGTPSDIAGFLQTSTDPGGEDLIIAVSRGGSIWRGASLGFMDAGISVGTTCTGALALTTAFTDTVPPPDPTSNYLLLLGIKGGTSSSGYYEVDFDISTGTVTSGVRAPGGTGLSSIKPDGNYGSSLRRYPVNHLFADTTQPPPVIFAATPKNGLYSYRDRSGWQWNYED
jgi:hypothetical protein